MPAIPRSQWASHNADLSDFTKKPDGIVLHHTADSGPPGDSQATEANYLRGVESYHVNVRGYKAIAYNYVIMPSGRVFAGRGFKQGGHTYNENDHLVGICFAGTFTSKAPTVAAQNAANTLIEQLKDEGKVGPSVPVTGHRDWGAAGGGTACPGDKTQALIEKDFFRGHLHGHDRPHPKGSHHHHVHKPHPHQKADDGHHHRHK